MQQGIDRQGNSARNPKGEAIELSVIVPTRNEADNIEPLLTRLGAALRDEKYEVVFVDDSTDQTPEVIRALIATSSTNISLVARPESQRNGLSGAVVDGFEVAAGRWVCVIDADLQHPPELIPRLYAQANRTGADLVVASRRADFLGPVGLSRPRALTSQVLTILARVVFPRVLKDVSDPLTGFFLVRRSAVDPANLQPEGFKILLEILVRHPELHVTELHFDFAPRHEGQSKADLNEGMRFFRHLIRLRLTINQHLIRFLIVILLSLTINLVLMATLVGWAGWSALRAAWVTGIVTIFGILVGETWIFSDRPQAPARRRLAAVFLLGIVFLIAIYLPTIWLLTIQIGVSYLVASLSAVIVAGFVYYLFSEQWIWTRGLMMRARDNHYYDIHGIVSIASQIPLEDLAYFEVPVEPDRIDLQVRVDRHGTPSRVAGAICYDEHLGRFGFGLTIIPGDFTEIVVSPLLESSPQFLYTNVLEPVLWWMFISRGHSLAHCAALQIPGNSSANDKAMIIAGRQDLSYGLSRLANEQLLGFMGDDRVLIGSDRHLRSFPKPVTINREMLPDARPSTRAMLALRVRRWLYSQSVRRLGLFLSRNQLPAATINTYLQRAIPQPKRPVKAILTAGVVADVATPGWLIFQPKGSMTATPLDISGVIDLLTEPGQKDSGFQPYPLIHQQISNWGGRDWLEDERGILNSALAGVVKIHCQLDDEAWWSEVFELTTRASDELIRSDGIRASA